MAEKPCGSVGKVKQTAAPVSPRTQPTPQEDLGGSVCCPLQPDQLLINGLALPRFSAVDPPAGQQHWQQD